jgi:hypothetical protein
MSAPTYCYAAAALAAPAFYLLSAIFLLFFLILAIFFPFICTCFVCKQFLGKTWLIPSTSLPS